MTKKVRIENADCSDHKLVVQTWQKTGGEAPDVLVDEVQLINPTDICDAMVWAEQYIVVKEV